MQIITTMLTTNVVVTILISIIKILTNKGGWAASFYGRWLTAAALPQGASGGAFDFLLLLSWSSLSILVIIIILVIVLQYHLYHYVFNTDT